MHSMALVEILVVVDDSSLVFLTLLVPATKMLDFIPNL